MGLNHELVGVESAPTERTWTSADTLLYALGVGAGHDDPLSERQYTTENSQDMTQQVLPTFAVMVTWGAGGGRRIGDFNPAMLVHAGQEIEIHRPVQPEGRASVTSMVTGIHDKGSGALVMSESRAVDPSSGEPIVTARSSVFIRGEGGFGGEPAPTDGWVAPTGDPDEQVSMPTWPGQALVYRLSGDRNPLHSDPAFAQRGGFERPILHGLCTYGVSGRALVRAMADGDGDRMLSMSGRFSAPVLPGEELTVSIWRTEPGLAAFQTRRADGTVVIDRGTARFRE